MKHVYWIPLVVALACTLTGCGGKKTESDNVLRVGNGAEVQDLDPHLVSGVTEHRVLSSLFEGLVDVNAKTMEPIPGVAKSWEISEDGKVYTFVLRDDARWSNGDSVTASDFVYAWQRMLSPKLGAEYAYLLHCLKNARAFNEGSLTNFGEVGVEAVSTHTLKVTLEHVAPYFLSMQIHFAWFPVHKATIEQYGAMDERGTRWTRAGNHVSNGAFRLEEWRPNEYIRAVRNEHYWDKGKVRLDGVEFHPIDNHQTEERSFRAGVLHMTSTVPIHKIPVYRREHPELLNITPYMGVYFYRMNVTREPFDDARVRRAFAMAINSEELCESVLKGGEAPAFHFTPPGAGGFQANARLPFDVAAAKKLLAEAGYPGGKGLPTVEILYNTSEAHKTVAEAIQRMWKEYLNVEVTLLNQDWKVYLSSMNNLDYSVARSAWIADVDDPVNFLECFLTGGGNNRTGWSSPAFDELVSKAYKTADQTAREKLLQEAEAILLDEAPIGPIYFYTWKFLRSTQIKNLTPNILGYIRWQDLYLEADGA